MCSTTTTRRTWRWASGNCLEGLASGPAIERRWGRKGAELSDCLAVWELEAFYIGQAICTYICTLSPERIVVGGGVMQHPEIIGYVAQKAGIAAPQPQVSLPQ